jgi:hypothetical protein
LKSMALSVAGTSGGGAVCARATTVPADQSRPQADPVLAIRLVTVVRFILKSLLLLGWVLRGWGWLESRKIDQTSAGLMDLCPLILSSLIPNAQA